MPPTSFAEMVESRFTIDAAGNEVDDEAALKVLRDMFAEGGARFLKAFHDLDVAGLNYIELSRLAVGTTLATAAAQLDSTPEMVLAAIPAGAPGVGGYSRSVLVQEPARLCRLGKERSAAAAHSAAPAAAAGAAVIVAAPVAAAPVPDQLGAVKSDQFAAEFAVVRTLRGTNGFSL